MNRPAGFSATATANAARAMASLRQIASVSSPYTQCQVLGTKRSYFARSEPFQFVPKTVTGNPTRKANVSRYSCVAIAAVVIGVQLNRKRNSGRHSDCLIELSADANFSASRVAHSSRAEATLHDAGDSVGRAARRLTAGPLGDCATRRAIGESRVAAGEPQRETAFSYEVDHWTISGHASEMV
jgi:hypothetical protein